MSFGDSSPFKVAAYWFTLPQSSTVAQYLMLAQAADASEYITPEQEAAVRISVAKRVGKDVRVVMNRPIRLCNGADGWFTELTGKEQGRAYALEVTYGYGSDASYALVYSRALGEPEDSSAHKALYSLCPPQASE